MLRTPSNEYHFQTESLEKLPQMEGVGKGRDIDMDNVLIEIELLHEFVMGVFHLSLDFGRVFIDARFNISILSPLVWMNDQ